MDSQARAFIESITERVVMFRRDLHAHPELAFEEERTAGKVVEWLGTLAGMEVKTGVGKTGIIATLGADKKGSCLALRADMDALPMHDLSGKPYASKIVGKAHTCGHDGHVASLLGAATVLARFPERLKGPVRFIFQPAEEGGGGARYMIEGGALENPRPVAIFGLHSWPNLRVGEVGMRKGAMMASSDAVDITIHGHGGHAARPHSGVDPVVAASYVVGALQTAVSRMSDPLEPVVLTIGQISGGTARNIIPDTVEMKGTLRTHSNSLQALLHRKIVEITTQVAAGFGARAEVDIQTGYPVTVNDSRLYDYACRVAADVVGTDKLEPNLQPTMGAEDFSYYGREIPAFFWRLGTAEPTGESPAVGLHNAAYDFNDMAIPTGIAMHCALIWNWEG